jgi:hypothetical protein
MNTALTRKCALCRNFGHQITQCMDAKSLEPNPTRQNDFHVLDKHTFART